MVNAYFLFYSNFNYIKTYYVFLEALQLYGDRLTDFEKQEINEYSEIWFLGLDAEKMHATNVKDYDDENGAYIKVNKDHIAPLCQE